MRAYSGAVQEGLKNSVIVEKCPGVEWKIHTDYNGIGKIQYINAQMEIPVLDTQYTDAVDVVCMVPIEKEGSLVAQITEKTGKAAGVKVVEEDDDILLISDDGTIIRMAAADVNLYSRTAQGVRVMRVSEGTKVISLARVPQENEGETQEET